MLLAEGRLQREGAAVSVLVMRANALRGWAPDRLTVNWHFDHLTH
jgi:hypothetical protein